MEIVDLHDRFQPAYFYCLEEWSEEMKESGDLKRRWFEEMKGKGLRVKLAIEDDMALGMIQYLPVEHSIISGKNLYFINCIWVHGHKSGVGNQQKRGIGKALLNAAETDIRTLNRHGVAAWGLALPFWMKASWFRKQGYKRVDRDEMAVLMWKAFRDDAVPPCWIKEKKRPEKQPGVVTVTSFTNGWCPAQNITHERAKRVAQEFAGQVVFQEINTLCPQTLCEWGISDALFVDGRPIRIGPPPSIDKIRSILAGQVRKIPS